MRASALLILPALAGLCNAHSLPASFNTPHNAPSTNNITTTQNRPLPRLWPPTPFALALTPTTHINITGYGRPICSSNIECERQIRADIVQIGWKTVHEYKADAQTAYSFTNGEVYFCIKQETPMESPMALGLLHALLKLTVDYGPTEVVRAKVMMGLDVVARFMLTFPGM